jgi:Resolvase, N terminal domain
MFAQLQMHAPGCRITVERVTRGRVTTQPPPTSVAGTSLPSRPRRAAAVPYSPRPSTRCRPRACWCWLATRSLMDGIHIMERVHKRGAFIKVLDRSGLDLTAPSGRGILALLSGLAEEERTRILRRANEARIAAIKRGTRLGRSLSPSSCSNCDVATSNSQLRAGRSADRRGSEGADTVPR